MKRFSEKPLVNVYRRVEPGEDELKTWRLFEVNRVRWHTPGRVILCAAIV